MEPKIIADMELEIAGMETGCVDHMVGLDVNIKWCHMNPRFPTLRRECLVCHNIPEMREGPFSFDSTGRCETCQGLGGSWGFD